MKTYRSGSFELARGCSKNRPSPTQALLLSQGLAGAVFWPCPQLLSLRAKPKKVAREITLLALHMGCGHLAHAVCRLAGEGPARRSLPDSARDSVPVRSSC